MTTRMRIPSYRHHTARNLAVVTLDGKDIYLGPFNSHESHECYHRLIAEWLAKGAGQRNPVEAKECPRKAEGPTVNDLILEFCRHAEHCYRRVDGLPTTELAEYRRTLGLLRELYGRTAGNLFGPLALKTVRTTMIRAGWSRGVINQRIGRIKRIFRWAVENELLPPAIHQSLVTVTGLRRGRSDAREINPVQPNSEAAVAATLPFLDHRAF